MSIKPQNRPAERGVALLSALLLVVVLAGVIVAVMDDIRLAIRRTVNTRLHDQALWYAYGAEELGRQTLRRSWTAQPTHATLNDPWAQEGVRFPIDGGTIAGRIADAGNCFNLNSVVQRDSRGRWVEREGARQQFERLAAVIGLNRGDAEALSATLTDWVDTDSAALPGGAEDADYMRSEPPFRTGSALLADASELRAMRGFSQKVYRALRPFVCALPTETPSLINVNTLSLEQAPLLVMIASDGLSLAAARRTIESRPLSGYANIDHFWSEDSIAAYKPQAGQLALAGVRTRYFLFETRVNYDAADITTSALMELDDTGHVFLRARRIGDFELTADASFQSIRRVGPCPRCSPMACLRM